MTTQRRLDHHRIAVEIYLVARRDRRAIKAAKPLRPADPVPFGIVQPQPGTRGEVFRLVYARTTGKIGRTTDRKDFFTANRRTFDGFRRALAVVDREVALQLPIILDVIVRDDA
ncbi:hypothetical protein D3C72_1456060 [compost metagenome]